MEKSSLKRGRYLREATRSQRMAAIIAALCMIVLLFAAIGLFFASSMNLLQPTPTSAAESQYLRARNDESAAIQAAEAQGFNPDTNPVVVESRMRIADAQLSMGQFTAAERTIQQVLNSNPENARAHILKGNIYETAENWDSALTTYRQALEHGAETEPELQREALRGAAVSLIEIGDLSQAYDSLSQAASIMPESLTLHNSAGELALQLERWQDAATHFYSVLRFDPENAVALQSLAMLEAEHADAASAALISLTDPTQDNSQDSP